MSEAKFINDFKESLQKEYLSSCNDDKNDAWSVERVQDLLESLQKCSMSVELLRETMIGKVVRKWKKHPIVGDLAKSILQQWKQVVVVAAADPEKETKMDAKKPKQKSHQSSSSNHNTQSTRLFNVKVKYIRPRYQNLQEWMQDESNNVYIGRRGVVFVEGQRFPQQDSRWANPFKIGANATQQDVIQQYEQHLRTRLQQEPSLKQELVQQLDGKQLGCWCHPEACHGDVLIRAIQGIKDGTGGW
jgi:hypothetical protein